VLSGATVQELCTSLRGQLTLPTDPGHDDARKIHNAIIDKHPRAHRPVHRVADVIASVHFARKKQPHGLTSWRRPQPCAHPALRRRGRRPLLH